LTKLGTYLVLRRVEPYWFSRSNVKVTGSNFYPVTFLWTLESTSFNGCWPNLVRRVWNPIDFQGFLRTKYVPSLVNIHWKMLILECSQGCYRVTIRPCDLDLWHWKSIGFQILLRTKLTEMLLKVALNTINQTWNNFVAWIRIS
jgi:hypothetical protein